MGRVAGVDEVGVGAIAGPIVTCAVVLDPSCTLILQDSKKMSEASRVASVCPILRHTLDYAMKWVLPEHIVGVHSTRLQCLADAADELMGKCPYDVVLVDGDREVPTRSRQIPVVRGDTRYACIQAGAILAKVARDMYMYRMAHMYPGYGFDSHKGYPTPQHKEALLRLGPSPIHRIRAAQKFSASR